MSKIPAASITLLLIAGAVLAEADSANDDAGIHRPVTSREVDQLKREISDQTRSSVEGIFDYHTETGGPNDRLDFWRFGARINYKWSSSSLVHFRATRTSYMTHPGILDEAGTNVTAGIRSALSDTANLDVEVGGTRFSNDGTTVNGLLALTLKPSEASSLYITGSRTNVEESLLSAAGIRPVTGPFAGRLVGQVMDNRGLVGFRRRFLTRFDFFAEGGAGTRNGKNVPSNFFRQAGGGIGYTILSSADDAPVTLLRASYGVDYFGFDDDRLGYGGVSLVGRRGDPLPLSRLGNDGISPLPGPRNPGVGGYFSPSKFVGQVGRIELQGRPEARLGYRLSGFAGAQNYTGVRTRAATGFSGTLEVRLSDRFSIPFSYLVDNFGPFTQHSFFFRLVARL